MPVIDDAIKVLKENKRVKEAKKFEQLKKGLESSDRSARASSLRELRGLCQVRAYGDLNITTMNGWKWNSLLDSVVRYADTKASQ